MLFSDAKSWNTPFVNMGIWQRNTARKLGLLKEFERRRCRNTMHIADECADRREEGNETFITKGG